MDPGETVEEKISLSERFGLWISFYPFSQEDYLAAVHGWLASFGVRLFDRTPDGYALTAAGESVRTDVERLE